MKCRRHIRRLSGGLNAALAFGLPWVPARGLPLGAAAPPPVETFTYKTVGALEIKADVYRPSDPARARPVLIYFHGGSLINGGRQQIEKHPFKDAFLAAGFVVVSPDYRLAPESKVPAIIEDLEDVLAWIRERGPALFGADPGRIAASGGSAGGYLTLVAGYRAQPRPFALIAEMSYGDLIGAWQLRPSIHPPHYADSHLGEAEAWRQVSGPPIANARDRPGDGGAFNDFIRRTAQWPKAVSGWDPVTEAEKFLPYLPLRHVTPAYPPTFLIHGEVDTDVPREQPEAMAAEFTRQGVEHRLVLLPHGEHGFRGADPAQVATARREAVEFVLRHLPASGTLYPKPAAATAANTPSP